MKGLAGAINSTDFGCDNFWRMRTPARSSLQILKHIADEIVGALREGSEGASERELLLVFEAHGYDPETFYGIVAGLEQEGLVRWHGNLLFPALLN